MYIQGSFPLRSLTPLGTDIFDAQLAAPEMAELARPGQFVHIAVPGFFLRRPISICSIDKAAGTLRLVFQIRGEGTAVLAAAKAGNDWDVIGPLGKGFQITDPNARAVVVGGGIGVPPLLEAAKAHKNCAAFLGFRNRAAVILEQDFSAVSRLTITTDDGSYGQKDFCTVPLRRFLETEGADVIYACGPMPMLRIIASIADELQIPCQLSLEERMGCGVGACLGCACKIKGYNGTVLHKRVCMDGPVFSSKEVVFDD